MSIDFTLKEPEASIRHIVKRFFVIRYEEAEKRNDFLLPDGTPSFFYLETDDEFFVSFYKDQNKQTLKRGIHIGFTNTLFEYAHKEIRIVGLNLYPVYLSLLFSASPDRFMNKFVRLDELEQADVMNWPEHMASLSDEKIIGLLTNFVAEKESQSAFGIKFKELYEQLITPEGHSMRVKEMAEWLGFSTRHTNEIFKKQLGMSPKKFLELVRFNHALKVMDELGEDSTLSQVAHEVGYHDQAHFIHDFKKICGKTPSELKIDPDSLAHKFRFFGE